MLILKTTTYTFEVPVAELRKPLYVTCLLTKSDDYGNTAGVGRTPSTSVAEAVRGADHTEDAGVCNWIASIDLQHLADAIAGAFGQVERLIADLGKSDETLDALLALLGDAVDDVTAALDADTNSTQSR